MIPTVLYFIVSEDVRLAIASEAICIITASSSSYLDAPYAEARIQTAHTSAPHRKCTQVRAPNHLSSWVFTACGQFSSPVHVRHPSRPSIASVSQSMPRYGSTSSSKQYAIRKETRSATLTSSGSSVESVSSCSTASSLSSCSMEERLL